MRYYEYLDYPGVDLLCNNNRSYWVAKQLQSAARQFGKKWTLSELYGCTGWQFDFASHKETGFWQALFGINLRCHHLAWVTMAGEAKRDYPASISFQSGWYREYKSDEAYFARLHVFLQQGNPVCDVLVLNPIESVWTQIHPGWAQWLEAKDPVLCALQQKYEDLFHWLTGAQVDFDYGDEDHLARFAKVEISNGEPLLHLGRCSYRVLVVGAMETMRSTTLKVLEMFHAAGGKLIFVGDAPPHLDALPSEQPAELARIATRSAHCREEALAAIEENTFSPVELQCNSTAIFCQVRREGDRLFIAAINTSRSVAVREVRFTVDIVGTVQEWECETGERFRQPSRLEDRATVWTAEFPPLGTRLFVISERDTEELPARLCFVPQEVIPADGPFDYTLNEPNLCVLDFAGDGSDASDAPTEGGYRPSALVPAGGSISLTITATPTSGAPANATRTFAVEAFWNPQDPTGVVRARTSVSLGAVLTSANVKANNTTNLNLVGSWTGGVVPGLGNVALWNNTVTAANTVSLGSNLNWGGISIANPGGAVTLNSGSTLTLYAGGVDLSGATQNITFGNTVSLGAPQTWNVAAGRNIQLNGSLVSGSGVVLAKSGSGQLTIASSVNFPGTVSLASGTLSITTSGASIGALSGTGGILKSGGGTFTIGSANVSTRFAGGITGATTLKTNGRRNAHARGQQ